MTNLDNNHVEDTLLKKPILVTGSHRSGTTWVGKMIGMSPSVGYIHEPFNLNHRPGICGAKFNYWFPYVSHENGSIFYQDIKNTLSFSYDLTEEIRAIKSPKDVFRLVRDYRHFLLYHHSNLRPLIKDPIAVFSAEWLASTFDMDVVVLIRHPAAFAGSLKRSNGRHPFAHFLKQPLLMRDYLYPFEDEITEFAEREHNIIDQAALLWNLIYYVCSIYRKKYDNWIFVRHEDLSRDPIIGFQSLFNNLNLEFSGGIRKVIGKYSSSANPSEATKGSNSFKIDSKSNIRNWKHRLTISEIEKIKIKVENVSKAFYSNEDWE